jgi:chromosome segregation ATPase
MPEDLREEYDEMLTCALRDSAEHYKDRCIKFIERIARAEARIEALQGELSRYASIEGKEHLQTIDERDRAEETLSQAYFLITGRSPEWSNLFGYDEALEDIDDTQKCLRAEINSQKDTINDMLADHAEQIKALTALHEGIVGEKERLRTVPIALNWDGLSQEQKLAVQFEALMPIINQLGFRFYEECGQTLFHEGDDFQIFIERIPEPPSAPPDTRPVEEK